MATPKAYEQLEAAMRKLANSGRLTTITNKELAELAEVSASSVSRYRKQVMHSVFGEPLPTTDKVAESSPLPAEEEVKEAVGPLASESFTSNLVPNETKEWWENKLNAMTEEFARHGNGRTAILPEKLAVALNVNSAQVFKIVDACSLFAVRTHLRGPALRIHWVGTMRPDPDAS